MAGYSGTPLAKKLGIKDGSRMFLLNAPENYLRLVAPLPAGVQVAPQITSRTDMIHIFSTKKEKLSQALHTCLKKNEAGRDDLGIMAQEIIESPDRHHRRHHKRGGAPAWTC